MYEGLRLTELHEEVGWYGKIAKRTRANGQCYAAAANLQRAIRADAEIRARVAAQIAHGPEGRDEFVPLGRPHCGCGHRYDQHSGGARCVGGECDCMEYFAAGGVELFSGIPDAERVYPAKRRPLYADRLIPLWSDWTNHKAHFQPVEGCHLCRGTIRFSLPAHSEKQ